jgi:LysM repeat protein
MTPTDVPLPTETPIPAPTEVPVTEIRYVVRPGDTLSTIAARNGITTRELAQRNNILNSNLIYYGQVLIIPVPQASEPVVEAPAAPTVDPSLPTAVVIPPATPFIETAPLGEPTPMLQLETYRVQPGDNLYRIALRFGVTVADLLAVNSLENPNRLFVGQELFIP